MDHFARGISPRAIAGILKNPLKRPKRLRRMYFSWKDSVECGDLLAPVRHYLFRVDCIELPHCSVMYRPSDDEIHQRCFIPGNSHLTTDMTGLSKTAFQNVDPNVGAQKNFE